jgi:hypothetical protein
VATEALFSTPPQFITDNLPRALFNPEDALSYDDILEIPRFLRKSQFRFQPTRPKDPDA